MSPEAVDSARCLVCRRPIWWGRTLAGKLMPIDVTPAEDGTVVLDGDIRALEAQASLDLMEPGEPAPPGPPPVRVLKKAEPRPEVARYVSHFVTCQAAARRRRR